MFARFFICYELTGDRSSPLRYVVVCTVSFATAFGCLSLTMQLLLFRKNHARLACSVVNALTTARCRYQLLRIDNCFQRKLSYINNNLAAAASSRPTMSSFANDCVEHLIKIARTSSSLSVQFNLFVHFLFFFSLGVFKKFLSYPNSA